MQAKASRASLVHQSPPQSPPYNVVHSGESSPVQEPAFLDCQSSTTEVPVQPHDKHPLDEAYWKQQYQKQLAYQAFTKQLTDEIRKSSDLGLIYTTALQGINKLFGVTQSAVLRLKFWDVRQMMRVAERVPKTRVLIEAVSTLDPSILPSHLIPVTTENGEAVPPQPMQSYWVSDCIVTQSAMKAVPKTLCFGWEQFQTLSPGSNISPLLQPERLPALLMVPLENKGRPLGFLVIQNSQARHWTEQEIDFAQLIAGQVSSAIIQTETLRQVESMVEDRTAQLQHSVDLQAKLYELNRKQIERLREMNKRMDEFLSTLSHELRTPLTSMMLAIRMLREAQLSPERRAQYLNILEQQCAQETSLINDLLALQELETRQVVMQLQSIDLPGFVRDLEAGFVQRWAAKGLSLQMDLPSSLMISTDVSSLNRVLLELLTNAGKYSDPSTVISLQVTQSIDRQIAVEITNQGGGIPADELPYIFEKFRRCQGITDNAVPGTGLGLALVKSLIQHLGGTISATSHPLEDASTYETTFTILLPKVPESAKG